MNPIMAKSVSSKSWLILTATCYFPSHIFTPLSLQPKHRKVFIILIIFFFHSFFLSKS